MNFKEDNIRIMILGIFVVIFGFTSYINKFSDKIFLNQILQTVLFFIIIVFVVLALIKLKKREIKILFDKLDKIKLKDHHVIIVYFFIAFISLWRLFLSQGAIGLRDDWSIPPFHEQVLKWSFQEKEAWSSMGFGTPNIYPSEYLLRFSLGGLTYLFNFDGEILSKSYLFFIIAFSGITAYYLGRIMKLRKSSSFFVGLFYMLTPVMFNRIIPGYLTYILSYALFPLIFALFLKFSEQGHFKIKNLVILGLITGIGCTHLNFFVLIPSFLILYTFIDCKKFVLRILYIIGSFIIAFLMHLNWILPLINNMSVANNLLSLKSGTWVESFNPSLSNVLLLLGATYPFFTGVVQQNISSFFLWILSALSLVFIVFIPFLIKPKNNYIRSISIITIIFLFISKGSNPPFGFIFKWFYENIKLLTIFRDIHNLLIIPSIGYASLIGFSYELIKNNIKKINHSAIFSIFIIVMVYYSFPFFTGNFGGYLQTYSIDEGYKTLYNNLASEQGDFRILLLPFMQPIAYPDTIYPGIDPLIAYPPKQTVLPLFSADTPQENYESVLDCLIHNNITTNIVSLLRFANIKYVIQRNDVISELPKYHYLPNYPFIKYNNQVINSILEIQKGLFLQKNDLNHYPINPLQQFKKYNIYQVNNTSFNKIRICDNPLLISGSYNEFIELNNDNLIDSNCVFFTSQINNADKLSDYISNIIIDDDYLEYISSFIEDKYKIRLNKFSNKINIEEGWASLFGWWWYSANYLSGLNGGVITRIPDTIKFSINIKEPDNYALLIKPFFSVRSSGLSLFIDGVNVSSINTNSVYKNNFFWVYLTDYYLNKGIHKVKIISGKGENVLGSMIIIPKSRLIKAYDKSKSLLNKNDYEFILSIKNHLNEPNKKRVSEELLNKSYLLLINNYLHSDKSFNFRVITPPINSISLNNSFKKFLINNYTEIISDFVNTSGGLIFNYTSYVSGDYSLIAYVKNNNSINICINNKCLIKKPDSKIVYLGIFNLKEGNNLINITGNALIKKLVFKKEVLKEQTKNELLNYSKKSETLYDINLKTNSKGILVFSETYDTEWSLGNSTHFLCNGFSNCFLLNQKTTNLRLVYKNQYYYNMGFMVLIITIISSIVLLIIKH